MRISELRFCALLLFLLASDSARSQAFLGDFTGCTREGNSVRLRAGESSVRVSFPADDVLRVDLFPGPSSVMDSSFAVVRAPSPEVPVTVRESDSSVTISSPSVRIICRKYPLRLAFADSSGREFLAELSSGGAGFRAEERLARFAIRPDEHFYGTGERGGGLDRRGQAFDCYNTQVGGYASAPATMNINVPLLLSTGGYALYFDNTYKSRFDIGASDSVVMTFTASGGELTYYLIAAPTLTRELDRYTWLTGRQPLPPRWAFGYIQSKNRYRDEDEARSVVRALREKGFPCDAIVLDLRWFPAMGDLRWDTTAWHDPEAMMSDFLAEGIRTILISEPYIVQSSTNFKEAIRLGYVAKDLLGKPYMLGGWWSCGGCNAALLDITNPDARTWWWSMHPPFMGSRVAGLWTDLGEPERHPDDMVHFLGSAAKVHNIYNLLWAKTIFDGFGRFRPGERIFNLTRSGFAGIQRFGAIPWSGDVSRTFGGLAAQLPMLLSMGMSGLAYHNSDIGGYARNPTTPELYVRWMEYGAFCPVARAHGAGEMVNGFPTEPWQFGPAAEEICRSVLRLRYRLLPYIYTLAHQAYRSGLPLARPLMLMYPGDARFTNESSSFMLGDELLVAPVVHAGETGRRVDLPEGDWVNYWTEEVIRGGTSVDVPAPLGTVPLFVKSGSILPMAPPMEYSDQKPLDTLTLCMYPAAGRTGSFTLYEDDGATTAYQSGSYSLTRFEQSVRNRNGLSRLVVGLGKSEGEFRGKILVRTYVLEIHGVRGVRGDVRINGKSIPDLSSVAALRASVNGYRFDSGRSRLTIIVTGTTASASRLAVSGLRLQ